MRFPGSALIHMDAISEPGYEREPNKNAPWTGQDPRGVGRLALLSPAIRGRWLVANG